MRTKGGKKRSKTKTGNLMDGSGFDPKPEHQLKQGGNITRYVSGVDRKPEHKQSAGGKRTREKAGNDSPHGEENMRLLGEKAGNDSPHGEENKRLPGEKAGMESSHGEEEECLLTFACSDCSDFELDLAKAVLKHSQGENKDVGECEVVQVLAACFDYSWVESLRCDREQCHISFSAKPKNDGYLRWFFAELCASEDGCFHVVRTDVLDPCDYGLAYGCSFCPPHVLYPHPPRFFVSTYADEYTRGLSAWKWGNHHHKS